MEQKAKELRTLEEKLLIQAKTAHDELLDFEKNCSHQWGNVVYDPTRFEVYTIPGDPPGTMGVDWRGPCYVPAKIVERWRRECERCGKEEYTENFKIDGTKKPDFRGARW